MMSGRYPHDRAAVVAALLLCVLIFIPATSAAGASWAQATAPGELLLTEVIVTPTDGEFVEIYNPTDATLDLSNVYLTDATFANGGTFYYNIVTGANAGGGSFGDFHARFPAGASIDPGEYQTVSLAGSTAFMAEYGADPTYELFEDDAAADAVPDMREATPGSINDQGGLTNSGEVVILYHWDGMSDLVQDLDYALWGDKDEAVDKSGVSIDGPDADGATSAYLPDTAIANQDVLGPDAHEFGDSWQRQDLNEGNEIKAGGNGANGDDETSEDLSVTWCNGEPTPNAAAVCAAPPPPPSLELRIREIQGAGHLSPFVDETVANVPGIVTVARSFGFYMQDPDPDADPATSEGIFVLSSDDVAVGDSVVVTGTISEYYPGGFGSGNLSTTELVDAQAVVLATGHPLPLPTVIGAGGRMPPAQVIEDDATGDANTSGVFDPASDGLDFYESLEGMLVQVNEAVAVGPTSPFGEIPIVGDGGAFAGVRSLYGGVVIRPDDFNPERILVDDTLIFAEPKVSTGARFLAPIVGVLDYSFGNFKLFNTDPLPDYLPGVAAREVTDPAPWQELTVATFNVLNLDPGDPAAKFANLAHEIVVNLNAPDILGLQEIQDNSGDTDDGVVDASATYQTLIAAITAAGGPPYDFRDIAPEDKADGGVPGGNIRVGFLFRTDRVDFIDRPGGDATTATMVQYVPPGPQLTLSPGRVYPNHPAWATDEATGFEGTRKSLAAEFDFNGHRIFVIVNHFKSKSGDDPLFGRPQPPVLVTERQRIAQAEVVNGFVDEILAIDPRAKVIVLGDMNDFEFSPPVQALKGGVLTNVVELQPKADRYSYIYDGNSQELDHLLISDYLYRNHFVRGDIVHVNADFPDIDNRPSDHDPVLATFAFPVWRFRGFVYQGSVGDRSTPLAGVTLRLYGRNAGESAPGVLVKSKVSQASGFFNLFVIQPWTYDIYRLVAEPPAFAPPSGMAAAQGETGAVPCQGTGCDVKSKLCSSGGAAASDGVVIDAHTIEWTHPDPAVHLAEFWFDACDDIN